MTLRVISTQAATILPLSSVKEWCRISGSAEDATMQSLIDAAIQQGEDVTWWSLRVKQLEVTYPKGQQEIKLPGGPIDTIDKIEIYDGEQWGEDDDALEVIDKNNWIEVIKTYPLRVTYTTEAYSSPMINMLLQDLIIAKWESRPEDSEQVNHILNRLSKHRNNVTL